MSTFDDDDIEFDFFDEADTEQATQRRRLPRFERTRPDRSEQPGGGDRPPRPPSPSISGFTPLLRLIGLIALMIFVVVVLVLWVQSCQGASKRSSYQHYMEHLSPIAQGSQRLGQQFTSSIATPGTKSLALAAKIRDFARQAQSEAADAQDLHPPGPLRSAHQRMVDTLVLRASGLARFADALEQTARARDASPAAALLVTQGQLLSASDVDWDFWFHDAAVQTLKSQNVTGVTVPRSRFLTNAELVGPDSMVRLFQALHGSGGTGSVSPGKHGNGVAGTKVLPAGTELSTSTPTTIKSSTELAFVVTVENSGDSQEINVPVTLTISGGSKPIVKHKTIDLISPGQQKAVTFENFADLPFGPQATVKVQVAPVPGEVFLGNNTAQYPVFFSL
jgi:CARDB protein